MGRLVGQVEEEWRIRVGDHVWLHRRYRLGRIQLLKLLGNPVHGRQVLDVTDFSLLSRWPLFSACGQAKLYYTQRARQQRGPRKWQKTAAQRARQPRDRNQPRTDTQTHTYIRACPFIYIGIVHFAFILFILTRPRKELLFHPPHVPRAGGKVEVRTIKAAQKNQCIGRAVTLWPP